MSKDRITELKTKYLAYYEDVPVQKYAAMAIGKDEDTIVRWRKADDSFSDAVKRAKAEWIRKKMLAVKAEFALERLEKDLFTQREEVVMDTPIPQAGTGNTADLRRAFVEFVRERSKLPPTTQPTNLPPNK